jgi:uncharacterized membrane protein
MERPAGVTLIALLEFLIATLLILFAMASAMGASVLGAILSRTRDIGAPGFFLFAGAGMFLAVLVLVPAVVCILLGYGLWELRNWARIGTMIFAILGVAGAAIGLLWSLTHLRVLGVMASSIRLSLNLLVLWYLSQSRVKGYFILPGS